MTDDPVRDYLDEAKMILNDLTGLLPQREHLQALAESYEDRLIEIAHALEQVKRKVLHGEE